MNELCNDEQIRCNERDDQNEHIQNKRETIKKIIERTTRDDQNLHKFCQASFFYHPHTYTFTDCKKIYIKQAVHFLIERERGEEAKKDEIKKKEVLLRERARKKCQY